MLLKPQRQPGRRVELRGIAEILGSTPFVGAVLAALTWPITSPLPSTGPDASWVAGLYMGLDQGLRFGTQFVFAYGPLGFVEQPVLYDTGLWVIAILYRSAIYFALATTLLWSARRLMPLLPAALLVYGLLAIGYLEAAAVLLAFSVCAATLNDTAPPWSKYLVALGGAVLGAIEVLGKLNFGLTILAMCVITLIGSPDRRRTLPLFFVALLSALVFCWVLTGQGADNVPEFASRSVQVIGGYSEAMGTNVSDVGWQRPWAIFTVLLLVVAAASVDVNRFRQRLAPAALATFFGFAMLKQSFVRQGLGNAMDFFPLMLGAAITLAWQLPVRIRRLPPHALSVVLIVPLATLAIVTLPRSSVWDALQPGNHLDSLRQDLRALASGSERAELSEDAASRMRARYRIDTRTLKLLRSRTVAVAPYEIGAAWAYGLDWRPLPVIQGYQAYTAELDSANVAALGAAGGPDAILVQNTGRFGETVGASIDDRLAAWDPPAVARAMLCRYRSAHTTGRWQVLVPGPNRCGQVRRLGTLSTMTDRSIPVPAPPRESVVFARVDGLGVEGLERLRSFLYRARQRCVTVNQSQSWRLVPGTLRDGLILRAAPGVDFPRPFELAPQARRLSFHLAGSERRLAISFYAQRVAGR